jgi:hypothetical protein
MLSSSSAAPKFFFVDFSNKAGFSKFSLLADSARFDSLSLLAGSY